MNGCKSTIYFSVKAPLFLYDFTLNERSQKQSIKEIAILKQQQLKHHEKSSLI